MNIGLTLFIKQEFNIRLTSGQFDKGMIELQALSIAICLLSTGYYFKPQDWFLFRMLR